MNFHICELRFVLQNLNIINKIKAEGLISITDPDLLQELYTTKANYVEKLARTKRLGYDMVGESILLEKTTDEQANKRKRLSVGFYKEKCLLI